jgi:hypothetical protein
MSLILLEVLCVVEAEMSTAAENMPLPRRGLSRKKLPHR